MSDLRTKVKVAALKKARSYILAHPTESKSQIALATGLSDSTIARARADLIQEGAVAPYRKTGVVVMPPPPQAAEPGEGTPLTGPIQPPRSAKGGNTLLDHEAMKAMADMVDLAVETGDDEKVHKALLKQCLTFAFRADLHPDTRMSASQMWSKLKDQAKQKDLGPGKPKTREEAVGRLSDMMIAAGPEITVEAVHIAFEMKGDSNAASSQQAAPPSPPAQDAGATGHEGDPTPA